MHKDGRFINNSNINAIVFSLKKDIIVVENPNKEKKIPTGFWQGLSLHRFFNMEHSLTFWQYDDLAKIIELQTSMINKLAKEKFFKW